MENQLSAEGPVKAKGTCGKRFRARRTENMTELSAREPVVWVNEGRSRKIKQAQPTGEKSKEVAQCPQEGPRASLFIGTYKNMSTCFVLLWLVSGCLLMSCVYVSD